MPVAGAVPRGGHGGRMRHLFGPANIAWREAIHRTGRGRARQACAGRSKRAFLRGMGPRAILPINEDITRASTLPGWVYGDSELHGRLLERAFVPSWQLVGDREELAEPIRIRPTTLLPGCLDEPLILTRDEAARVRCLSNVCTHRGNLVALAPDAGPTLRCGYHGRTFALDGSFRSMPDFEQACDFPGPRDDLPSLPCYVWRGLVFASLGPRTPMDALLRPLEDRVPWFPFEALHRDTGKTRSFTIRANWILYCDNYLEGFHIPFVHPSLHRELDPRGYDTELFEGASLQVGEARSPRGCFDVPSDAPDAGRSIAGYYYWIYPNTMLNLYPWGLSVNIVVPLGPTTTRVDYRTYRLDPPSASDAPAGGAGGDLDAVEREDDAVVESTQRGVRSRLYEAGRYSPTRERAVHHFHRRLVTDLLPGGA